MVTFGSEHPESLELTELGLDLPDFSIELQDVAFMLLGSTLSLLTAFLPMAALDSLKLLLLCGLWGLQSLEWSLKADLLAFSYILKGTEFMGGGDFQYSAGGFWEGSGTLGELTRLG